VRLARGGYLVIHVLGCMHCHAEHEWTSGETNTLGAGQDINMLKGPTWAIVRAEHHTRSGNGRR